MEGVIIYTIFIQPHIVSNLTKTMPYNIVHYYLVMDKKNMIIFHNLQILFFLNVFENKKILYKRTIFFFNRHIIGMEGRRKQLSQWGPLTLAHNEIWKINYFFFKAMKAHRGFCDNMNHKNSQSQFRLYNFLKYLIEKWFLLLAFEFPLC